MWNPRWGGLPAQDFLSRVDPLLDGIRAKIGGTFCTSDKISGTLAPHWAERMGLKPGIPIPVSAFDAEGAVKTVVLFCFAKHDATLDAAHTLDVIEQSSGQSWIGSDRLRRAIAGDYAPRAHVTLLGKDTRLAMDAARAAGFEGPLGAAARDTFARAVAAGLGDLDDAALYRLLSE